MGKKKAPEQPAMKRWSVSVPFTGYVVVEVEAPDEKAAINAALDSKDLTLDNCEECDFHEYITQGNVFYGVRNDAEAEEIEP